MIHNDQCTLVSVFATGPTVTRQEKTVYCAKKSVNYKEFYAATQVGLNPSYVFEIDTMEFEDAFGTVGQTRIRPTELIYNNEKFNIIRTYEPNRYLIEVTVGP